MRRMVIIIGLLYAFLLVMYVILCSVPVRAGYLCHAAIDINTTVSQTAYAVTLNIPHYVHMAGDFSDLSFAENCSDESKRLYAYKLTAGNNATIVLNLTDIGSNHTYCMFYMNSTLITNPNWSANLTGAYYQNFNNLPYIPAVGGQISNNDRWYFGGLALYVENITNSHDGTQVLWIPSVATNNVRRRYATRYDPGSGIKNDGNLSQFVNASFWFMMNTTGVAEADRRYTYRFGLMNYFNEVICSVNFNSSNNLISAYNSSGQDVSITHFNFNQWYNITISKFNATHYFVCVNDTTCSKPMINLWGRINQAITRFVWSAQKWTLTAPTVWMFVDDMFVYNISNSSRHISYKVLPGVCETTPPTISEVRLNPTCIEFGGPAKIQFSQNDNDKINTSRCDFTWALGSSRSFSITDSEGECLYSTASLGTISTRIYVNDSLNNTVTYDYSFDVKFPGACGSGPSGGGGGGSSYVIPFINVTIELPSIEAQPGPAGETWFFTANLMGPFSMFHLLLFVLFAYIFIYRRTKHKYITGTDRGDGALIMTLIITIGLVLYFTAPELADVIRSIA